MGLWIIDIEFNQSLGDNMSDGGKGSQQRPTDQQKYRDNWEQIFGRNKQ